jgi:hypothetical protein
LDPQATASSTSSSSSSSSAAAQVSSSAEVKTNQQTGSLTREQEALLAERTEALLRQQVESAERALDQYRASVAASAALAIDLTAGARPVVSAATVATPAGDEAAEGRPAAHVAAPVTPASAGASRPIPDTVRTQPPVPRMDVPIAADAAGAGEPVQLVSEEAKWAEVQRRVMHGGLPTIPMEFGRGAIPGLAKSVVGKAILASTHLSQLNATPRVEKAIRFVLGDSEDAPADALTQEAVCLRFKSARSTAMAHLREYMHKTKGTVELETVEQGLVQSMRTVLGEQASMESIAWLLVLGVTVRASNLWLTRDLEETAQEYRKACPVREGSTRMGSRTGFGTVAQLDVSPILAVMLDIERLVESMDENWRLYGTEPEADHDDVFERQVLAFINTNPLPDLAQNTNLVEYMKLVTEIRSTVLQRRVATAKTQGLNQEGLRLAVERMTVQHLKKHRYQDYAVLGMHRECFDNSLLVWSECRTRANIIECDRSTSVAPRTRSRSRSASRGSAGGRDGKKVHFKEQTSSFAGSKRRGKWGKKRPHSPAPSDSVYAHDETRAKTGVDSEQRRKKPVVCFNCGKNHPVAKCKQKCRGCGAGGEHGHWFECKKPLKLHPSLDEATKEFAILLRARRRS